MSGYVFDPALKEMAKTQFAAQYSARTLVNDAKPGQISAGRLYRFMSGGQDETVAEALKQDLPLRRMFKTLLSQQAYFHMPEAQAASSDDMPDRHCDGCTLRFMASRAESEQVYLIVEVNDQRRDMPRQISVFLGDDAFAVLELPPARNGVIQTIIDKTSPVAQLLRDPKSEIFLR